MAIADFREIVNGSMLPQFNSKKVSITGLVQNINPNGLTFELRATDDVIVKVNLRKPYKDLLEGHVEVHGTAQGTATVICDEIVQFPSDKSADFDAASYNTVCTLLQSVPYLWENNP